MHRSGTSAVSGELVRQGVDFGGSLLVANEFNPKGYFEDREAVALNENLLAAAYGHWSAPLPAAPARVAAAGRAHGTGLAACLTRLTAGGLGGLKDPRICRVAPLWDAAAREVGVAVLPLVVIRDPAEVAASLSRRDCMAPAWGAALWLLYLRDTLAWLAGSGDGTFGLVAYDDCLERPAILADWLDGALPGRSRPPEGDSFLEAGLRHAPPPDCLTDPAVVAAQAVHAGLKALTGGAVVTLDAAAAAGALPGLDAALAAALPQVTPEVLWRVTSPEVAACWAARRARQRAEGARLWERVAIAERDRDALHAESQALWQRVHDAESRRDALLQETQELWKRVSGAEAERATLRAENQDLWKRVNGAEAERAALHTENQELWKRVDGTEADRAALHTENQELWKRVDIAETALDHLGNTFIVRAARALRLI
ncbi:hypothetical protein ACM64Y_06595 [Novispirillum sp. DQ9]|uniref:hypothetical protein n=1 Tax=Novispirillum sp. DQ9 TaxID=3398612 RepID=UPI003C7E3D3A